MAVKKRPAAPKQAAAKKRKAVLKQPLKPSKSSSTLPKRPTSGVFVRNAPENESSQAEFETKHFAEGGFRFCYRGHYFEGPRRGQSCVMKEFKSGCVHEATYFEADITAVKKAAEFVKAFNDAQVVSKGVYLTEPEVWTGTGGRIKSQKMLVEPMIDGEYFKFNSNTGYAAPDSATMQALSHFSYHHSNGKYLVCDLQGGRYDGFYILTDPVIHSKTKEFGGTDLGEDGITNFMAHHKCGRFCNPNWKMPPSNKMIPMFEAVAGTTFGSAEVLFTDDQRQNMEIKVKKEVRISIRKLWENALDDGKKNKMQIIVNKTKNVESKQF